MKILLSGGEKTQNIVNGVSKKFSSSGDEFIVVPFIDNINEIYNKGDYYDKAIITEQSITQEFTINDEFAIRRRVNDFATSCSQISARQSFVFLTQDEQMANLICEEIAPIERSSAVVLKSPPYSVGFFSEIIITDVNQLNAEYVYKQPDIRAEAPQTVIEDTLDIDDGFDITEGDPFENIPVAGNDGFDLPFDMDGTNTNNISDAIQIDNGTSIDGINQGFDNGFDTGVDDTFGNEFTGDNAWENMGEDSWNNNEGDLWNNDNNNIGDMNGMDFGPDSDGIQVDNTGIGDMDFNNFYPDNTSTPSDFGGDETLNIDGITPITQSGDLPDYTIPADTATPSDFGTSMDDGMYTNDQFGYDPNADFKPNDNDMYNNQTSFDDDLYGNNQNQINQNQNNINSGHLPGFDQDDYDNNSNTQIPNNVPMGFDPNEYDNVNNNPYGVDQMNPAVMAAGAVGAMEVLSDDIYNTQQTMANQQAMGMNGQQDMGMGNQMPMNNQMMGNGQMQMNGQAQQGPFPQQQIPPQMGPMPNQNRKGFLGKVQKNQPQDQFVQNLPKVSADDVRNKIRPFAVRGNSIVVTGCGGCGTSTVAYNIANIISQLGYTVLLVDMDVRGRSQCYIAKANYNSLDQETANLVSAINSTTGVSNYTSVVKTGFHLLTIGLANDITPVNELIHKEKVSRFINLAKTSYNFVIYDIPFIDAIGFLSEMTYMSDNLVLVTDASNWGVTKTMLSLCNIPTDDMQDTMFSRAQIVFNKYRRLYRLFGKKVKTAVDITKCMDQKVYELVGEDIGLHFEDMHIAGIINDDPAFEDGWYEDVQYSDTARGKQIFLKLLLDIMLKS